MMRLWDRLSLLQRFTVTSLAIAVAIALVLSLATLRAIESFAVEDEAKVAAELMLRSIASQLQQSDFGDTLPPPRKALLDALFTAHGDAELALRIRLWRADGRLLYSNVPEPQALQSVGADLSTKNGFAVFVERQGRVENTGPGAVRFFLPVQLAGEAKPIAAFEILYDLARLQPQRRYISRVVWTAVPISFLVLYASIFVLVRRASQRLLKQQADLIAAHLGTYQSLASAIDAKDSYTGDHSTKVAELAAVLARALKVPEEMVEDVRIGARLHDLGKIGVPDAILMKSGPLSSDELPIMRRHAERGYEILRKAPLSARVKLAVRHSHEHWDGQGYPEGLTGEAIPLMSRIVAVVDAYEAMTSDRPYRKAISAAEALQRLERDAGSHFDPRITRVFLQLMRKNPTLQAPDHPTTVPH
jgi:putative nucleotidyltransferase with HDIG domain